MNKNKIFRAAVGLAGGVFVLLAPGFAQNVSGSAGAALDQIEGRPQSEVYQDLYSMLNDIKAQAFAEHSRAQRLQAEVDGLKEKIAVYEKQVKDNETVRQKISLLEDNLDKAQSRYDQLQNELKSAQKALEENSKQAKLHAELKLKYSGLEDELRREQAKRDQLQNELKSAQTALDENFKQAKLHAELKLKYSGLEDELRNEQTKCDQLQGRLKRAQDASDEAAKQIKQLVELKGRLSEAQNENLALKTDLSAVRKTLTEREKDLSDYEDLKKKLSQEWEKNKNLQDKISQLEKTQVNRPAAKSVTGLGEMPVPAAPKALEKINSNNLAVYEQLAAAYVKAKQYDEAISAYQQILSLEPGNVEANYYLGLLYAYSRPEADRALAYLRKYLELEPQGQYSDKVKKIIKMLE